MDADTLFPTVRASKQKEYIEKFNMIFDYIDKNYTEDLSLDTVSSVAGFSKFHFSRLFKQFTDISFYDYLNQRRVRAAENLLLDPDIPITVIALQSGFSSISTFNRVFKCFKECTPSEFKELYRTRNWLTGEDEAEVKATKKNRSGSLTPPDLFLFCIFFQSSSDCSRSGNQFHKHTFNCMTKLCFVQIHRKNIAVRIKFF